MKQEPFSWRARDGILNDLEDEYDIIVIGGGIIGCGVSLEAARQGYRVLLLEKGDIGSGTSSRSSRLIHGGLRYLRYGKLKLVWEASRERYWLRTTYPHLVRPLPFIIPFHRGVGEGIPATLLGLWLYDILAGFNNIRRHRRMSKEEVLADEPGLRSDGLLGGALYYDCGTDDFRLVLLNAVLAHRAGADVLTYATAESLILKGGLVAGVRFRDLLHDQVYEARGRAIVNATGPWSDEIRLMLPSGDRKLRPTKGAHIFVPASRVGNRNAVVMRSPADERVVFALPWGHLVLVGTTDTDFEGKPDNVRTDGRDVEYLLESVNHSFPEARLTKDDVVSSYAALRPLIAEYGVLESEVTRDFKIVQDAHGLVSIFGGKLTTYRRAARQVMRRVNKLLAGEGRKRRIPGAIQQASLSEGELEELEMEAWRAGTSLHLDQETVDHLIASYGREYKRLLEYAQDESLRDRVVPELPYVLAEVIYGVEQEMALKLEDALARRTRVMYEDSKHGLDAAEVVAGLMADRLGWSENRLHEELREYREVVASMEAFRQGG